MSETRPKRSGSPTSRGFGRILVLIYAIFALSATARSVTQLITKYDEAPVAYLLSAFAALVYIVATVALARSSRRSRTVATLAIGIELVGVVTVGILTLVDKQLFPDATVWSDFGQGYGFVPLVLPFVGLWWLWYTRPRL